MNTPLNLLWADDTASSASGEIGKSISLTSLGEPSESGVVPSRALFEVVQNVCLVSGGKTINYGERDQRWPLFFGSILAFDLGSRNVLVWRKACSKKKPPGRPVTEC